MREKTIYVLSVAAAVLLVRNLYIILLGLPDEAQQGEPEAAPAGPWSDPQTQDTAPKPFLPQQPADPGTNEPGPWGPHQPN